MMYFVTLVALLPSVLVICLLPSSLTAVTTTLVASNAASTMVCFIITVSPISGSSLYSFSSTFLHVFAFTSEPM